MDYVTKEIVSEVKEEAREAIGEVKEVTLEAAEVVALMLTIGLAGMALVPILLALAMV